jgi:hypothetical protein
MRPLGIVIVCKPGLGTNGLPSREGLVAKDPEWGPGRGTFSDDFSGNPIETESLLD